MSLVRIDFMWYQRRTSALALTGDIAWAAAYLLQYQLT